MGDQKVNVRHHGRGIRTAIVGNCDHFTRPAVQALTLEDEVDALILSIEVGAMKPDAPVYEEALGQLTVDAHRRSSWTPSPTATRRPPSDPHVPHRPRWTESRPRS